MEEAPSIELPKSATLRRPCRELPPRSRGGFWGNCGRTCSVWRTLRDLNELGIYDDNGSEGSVKIVWQEPIVSNAEILALRKLRREYANEPIEKLKEQLSREPSLNLGKMSRGEAKLLREAAQRVGLAVEYEERGE